MYSGVAGLKGHQLKMDVIGNNIANVNTYGFKAGRATFSDMFSQTLSDATQANGAGTLGGIDPRQVGLGTVNSTIDNIHTAGAFQSTDRTLDTMIVDEGFYTVTNGDDVFYTRAGNLYLDSYGYLITASGEYVMGKMFLSTDDFDDEGPQMGRITLDDDQTRIAWGEGAEAQLSAEPGDPTAFQNYLDDMGIREEGDNGYIYNPFAPTDEEGVSVFTQGEMAGRMLVPSSYRQISIDESGILKGLDENGLAVDIGVLVTATFMNPGGLTKVGENMYQQSSNSGGADLLFPGVGPNGSLKIGGLEMSNVDLANEFTSMIVTQRGYQSNSRVITVSDTLLEELINLKR
ncbi:MAG: flagellar hook-basal body complex protein [Oscillospiraceae bacterium]|nr:flagellar hook-basal body complex protein [Oscillospiraceae bacterium]